MIHLPFLQELVECLRQNMRKAKKSWTFILTMMIINLNDDDDH